jgi:hypothetical protein
VNPTKVPVTHEPANREPEIFKFLRVAARETGKAPLKKPDVRVLGSTWLGKWRQFRVGKYKRFKYGYASSAKAAFEKECKLYHDFEPRDNEVHPARPAGTNWECPRCPIFD